MKGKRFDVKQFLGKNSVPVLFIIICAVLIPVSGVMAKFRPIPAIMGISRLRIKKALRPRRVMASLSM